MDNYYTELVGQYPIIYHGLTFYPISFEEIYESVGLEQFNNLIFPFSLTKDYFSIPEDTIGDLDLFEDIILQNENFLYSVVVILSIFCKCNDIRCEKNELVLTFPSDKHSNENSVPDEDDFVFRINKQNFDDIANILLKINGKTKIKVEKPPPNMTKRQKDIWDKLQEGRQKEAAKNALQIYDILNICEFAGGYHIPQEEIRKWTLWKIYNCFRSICGMNKFDEGLQIALVSGKGEDISGKNYWLNKLRICDES